MTDQPAPLSASVPQRNWRSFVAVLFRVGGSALLACVVVFTMLVIGLRFYNGLGDGDYRNDQPVEWLSADELRKLLGEDGPRRPELPELKDIPAAPLPQRSLNGFVQLEMTVQPDGSVSDVRVLGATPAGVYEDQARAQIEARRYVPTFENGAAVPSVRTEIVDFSVPMTRPDPAQTKPAGSN